MGCHFLLQGIFPTQGSKPGLPHCRQTLYSLSHQGSPGQSKVFLKVNVNNYYKQSKIDLIDVKDGASQMYFTCFSVSECWKSESVSCTSQSVQFSRSVVSDSLRPHESQHARPPCPSPTPVIYSNSCLSSR